MTRVALLPSSYPPSPGGVAELTRELVLALASAGDMVEVWSGQPDDAMSETVEMRDEILVRRLPMPLPAADWPALHRSATTGFRTLFSLRDAVAAFRPDVLHVMRFGHNGAYATALARLTGRPLVVTLQGETLVDADRFASSRRLRASLRNGLRRSAAVTACSGLALGDAERGFGLAAGRGLVIPNGIVLAGAGPDGHRSERPAALPARPYILGIGHVSGRHGFDLLLDAYAAIGPDRCAADLVIAGTGPALADLCQRASLLGAAERVHFVGRLDRRDADGAMAHAELVVVPGRLEPSGGAVLEAWRNGAPVVVTNRGAPADFVYDGGDAILVDPFDRSEFVAVLERLLADGRMRRSLAASGRTRVASFAWPIVAERYREVYATVTGRAPEAPGNGPRGGDPAGTRSGRAEGRAVA